MTTTRSLAEKRSAGLMGAEVSMVKTVVLGNGDCRVKTQEAEDGMNGMDEMEGKEEME